MEFINKKINNSSIHSKNFFVFVIPLSPVIFKQSKY